VKDIVPPMLPVVPEESVIVKTFEPFIFNAEPDRTSKSAPAPPAIVNVFEAEACRLTVVFPDIFNCAMDSEGTFVTVTVPPPLNSKMSDVLVVDRVGVQFVEVE